MARFFNWFKGLFKFEFEKELREEFKKRGWEIIE
jgi:hypothetical protein